MDSDDLVETIAQTHAHGPTGIVGREVAARILANVALRGYVFDHRRLPDAANIDPVIEQAGG